MSMGLYVVCLQFMDNYEPTKADNYRKNVKTEDGVECQLDILDTAGMLKHIQSFQCYIQRILIYKRTPITRDTGDSFNNSEINLPP